jgi:hypothetical protein
MRVASVTDIFPEPRRDTTPTDISETRHEAVPVNGGCHDDTAPYGSAIVAWRGGQVVVESADATVGMTPELLLASGPVLMPTDSDGNIWLGGDPKYKYRPARFVRENGCHLIVVCERVVDSAGD